MLIELRLTYMRDEPVDTHVLCFVKTTCIKPLSFRYKYISDLNVIIQK